MIRHGDRAANLAAAREGAALLQERYQLGAVDRALAAAIGAGERIAARAG